MNLKSNIEKNIKHYVVVLGGIVHPFYTKIREYSNRKLSLDEVFEKHESKIIKDIIFSVAFYLLIFLFSYFGFPSNMFDTNQDVVNGVMLGVLMIFSGMYIFLFSIKMIVLLLIYGKNLNKNIFKNFVNILFTETISVTHQFLIEDKGIVLSFHFEKDELKKIDSFQNERIESVASLISFFEKINGMNVKSNVESVNLINTKTLYIKTKNTEKSKFIFQKLNLEANIECNGDYIKIDLIDEKDPCKIVKIDEIGKE